MNSFLKITRGELDKIFVRPAIFIMTGFFVLAIVASVLMFNPSPRNDLYQLANIEGNTVIEVYTNFNNNQNKLVYDQELKNNYDTINFYLGNDNNEVTKETLVNSITSIQESYNKYNNLVSNYVEGSMAEIIEAENTLQNSILNLIDEYSKINSNFLTLLVTEKSNDKMINSLNQFKNEFMISEGTQDIEHHKRILNSIKSNNYISNIDEIISNITSVSISKELLEKIQSNYLDVAQIRINDIYNDIISLYNKAIADEELNTSDNYINEIKTYANNYKLTINQTTSILNDNLLLEIFDGMSTSKVRQFIYEDLNTFNRYQVKENLTKNEYLFDNQKFSYEYANVFQSNVNSNDKTNAFDFMYYALEFLSFVIIIFCVIIGSGMIAGETSGGTMKMLAIRPYKRSKIITGKLFATFLLGVIFLIIGTLTTFIIGARLYGLNSLPILLIFNAETVSTISAGSLFAIFLALLLVRIIVYTILAVFISTAFKSNVAAVIISVIIYVFVALFGNLFGESVIYGYLPFANVDLFRYLGGEFVTSGGSVLGLDFSCPIQPDSNFYIRLIIVAVFVAILLALTYIIFKKRDIE